MEAEYVSLTEAAKEFIWLKNVIDNKSLNLELSENSRKVHSDLNHDSSIGHQLPANFHPLSQTTMHCHFRCLKACSFASFIHTSLLGFGWKRVATNSGPKYMLKKRRVSPSQNHDNSSRREDDVPDEWVTKRLRGYTYIARTSQ
ncbi:hypothetical protein TNCV_4688831 [Trichonephila clavipes]|nr:hypothetical protein TNCV_4688831 [Trichonephila clavipes]